MVFTSDDLVDALIGNAKNAGKFGLRFARLIARDDNLIAFTSGKGRVRRQRKRVYPPQYAGNREGDWL
jgi:hypothetical protein